MWRFEMMGMSSASRVTANILLFAVLATVATGCGPGEPFSWSIGQAKSKGTLKSELNIYPGELTINKKRIVFGPAWIERRPDGDYTICFRLKEGNEIFGKEPCPFFVLDDLHRGISERHGRDWLQFVARVDTADISKMRASLIQNWSDARPKNIRFIRKP
jgi:hypothetical protein